MARSIARNSARSPRQPEEAFSLAGYLLQGAGFLGFLMMLFLLAGFRG